MIKKAENPHIEGTQEGSLVVQNPQALHEKLRLVTNMQFHKTILYLGGDQAGLERLFRIIDDGVRDVSENRTLMTQLECEAHQASD